jgi:HEAT repeat protein
VTERAPQPKKPAGTKAPPSRPAPPSAPLSAEDRARQDALFADACMEATAATAADKDPEAAASILARKHSQGIVRVLCNALKRGQPADLIGAKRVAGHLFDKGARLIDVFLRSKPRNDTILERCARLVGEVGAPEGVERLRNLLKDPTPAVRAAAFEGLAFGMDPDRLGKLVREVIADAEEAPEVKLAAMTALGEAKAIGASSVAAKCIHDGNADVRKAATRTLTRMGAAAIPGILEDVRARGQEAIGSVVDSIKAILGASDLTSVPPELVESMRAILVGALRDKDSSPVRWAASISLAVCGAKDDVPAMDDAITFEKSEIAKANMECARVDLKKRLGIG